MAATPAGEWWNVDDRLPPARDLITAGVFRVQSATWSGFPLAAGDPRRSRFLHLAPGPAAAGQLAFSSPTGGSWPPVRWFSILPVLPAVRGCCSATSLPQWQRRCGQGLIPIGSCLLTFSTPGDPLAREPTPCCCRVDIPTRLIQKPGTHGHQPGAAEPALTAGSVFCPRRGLRCWWGSDLEIPAPLRSSFSLYLCWRRLQGALELQQSGLGFPVVGDGLWRRW